jgi:hypothetical protein
MLALAALFSVCLASCASTMPVRIQPRGFLDTEEYSALKSTTEREPRKIPAITKDDMTAAWMYTRLESVDSSSVTTIAIPPFKAVDPRTEENVIKAMLDAVGQRLIDEKIFASVDRTGTGPADWRLEGAVLKYKQVSGGERAATFLLGAFKPAHAYIIVECKIIDNRSKRTIGVAQFNAHKNVTGLFFGLGALMPGQAESEAIEQMVTVFKEIKAGKREGVSPELVYLKALELE